MSTFYRVLGHVDGAVVRLPGIFTYDEALVRQATLEVARKRGDKIVKLGPPISNPAIVPGVIVRTLWFIVRSIDDPQGNSAPELRLVVLKGRGTADIGILLKRRFKGKYAGDHGGHIRRVNAEGKLYGYSVSHGWWGMLNKMAPGEVIRIQQERTPHYFLRPVEDACDDCGGTNGNHDMRVEH